MCENAAKILVNSRLHMGSRKRLLELFYTTTKTKLVELAARFTLNESLG